MSDHFVRYCALVAAALGLIGAATAQTPALRPLGIGLEDIDYPYPVHFFDLAMEGQPLRMAYMDVAPFRPRLS